MKNHGRIILWLALSALLALDYPIIYAEEATLQANGGPAPAAGPDRARKTKAIPWNQIGAKAGTDYHGDGLSVIAEGNGARLHCVFQRLDGEATPGGLWLVSAVTNQTNDLFQVKAVEVGRVEGETFNIQPEKCT
jgi:hypothetical protein